MKSRKQSKNFIGQLGNQGFSLIELLVSIVILILIMVPLMHNFFGSAKVNSTAKKLQDYSNMAANVMEDLKSMNLEQMLLSPDYKHSDIHDGIVSDCPGPGLDEDVNYFRLMKTTESGENCDVLVTINTDIYKYSDDPTKTQMNSYKIPTLETIDDKLNGLLFSSLYQDPTTNTFCSEPVSVSSKDLDDVAWAFFENQVKNYVNAKFNASSTYQNYLKSYDEWKTKSQEALLNSSTVPTPPTKPVAPPLNYSTELSKKWVTKTMNIVIGKDAHTPTKGKISYQITYQCDTSSTSLTGLKIDDQITFNIGDRVYGDLVKKVYLYYQNSVFQPISMQPDKITITNDSGKDVAFYIRNQSTGLTNPLIDLKRYGSIPVDVYSNLSSGITMSGTGNINKDIITYNDKIRIASVNVKIYKHQADLSSRYKNEDLLYSLDSNREE